MSSASNTASTSSNFETFFNVALAKYTKQTGKDLRNHPLTDRINSCDSVDSILEIFQEQAREFGEFRDRDDKLFKWLKPVVNVLHALSTNADLSDIVSLGFPPAKAVFSGIGILLSVAKDIRESYDALVDIFECIENFLRRLRTYSEIPPTPAVTEIVTKIMVEILSVLALATKQIKQGRFKKYANKFLGDKEIESVLLRLDRLTLEESKTTVAQTLGIVHGLVNNMQVVMEDGKASTSKIRRTLVIMQEMAVEVNRFQRDQLQVNFRRWLSASDPWVNHNAARKAHHPGTGTWFTQGDTFNNWKLTGSPMWIHGLPGSGKSVLCSTIIQEVREVCQVGLATFAFFYFDFRNAGEQDARSLLSSLLIQFSHQSDKFSEILSARYSTHAGFQQPSEDTLMECLRDMLTFPGQGEMYIVVDALDECPNSFGCPSPREQVLNVVKELLSLHLPHLHFCILSRPEVDIQDALKALAVHNVALDRQTGQNEDIFNYIKSVVSSDPMMQRWREENRQSVIKALAEKAGGMFRWTYCQFETLRRCFPEDILRILNELPETLDGTYEQTLRGIDKQKRDHAHRLFQCLVVSKRPLHVEELAELFAIRTNTETIPTFDASLRPESPEQFILSACSTLVAVVNANRQKIVQFSHFSVREYLTSDRIAMSKHVSHFHVLPRLAHALLARACLAILLQLGDHVGRDNIQNFPLALYAAKHWVDHARFESVSSDIQDGMKCLFDRDKPHFAAWLSLYNIDYPSDIIMTTNHPARPYPVPLYYAALCGLCGITENLIDAHPQDVNARGGRHATPLHAALEEGHLSVAMLLLERGADMASRDSRSQTPLHIASDRGYAEIVSLLVDRGADLNAEGFNRETPLYLALTVGRQDIARLLLKHGADVNHPENQGLTPLDYALLHGHNDVVQLLLNYGADTNRRDNRHLTPLHHASMRGLNDIVQLLIDHGADPNHQDDHGWTPLHHAWMLGLNDIVQLLLDLGADANRRDDRGWTLLHHASMRGHSDIVLLLLDHGADANHRDTRGWTPLHHAMMRGHNEIVQLLLDRGADANHRDNRGWTPLHHASMRGYDETVQLLLDRGAVMNPEDCGMTPLHLAELRGDNDLVQLLRDHDSVANHPDRG